MLKKIPFHHQKFSILSHEADVHNCASLYSLNNYMQEAGRSHTEQLGWGTKLFADKKQFWVLSRMIISVDKFPRTGSEIEVETWPKNKDKIFALRDFLVRQGDEIIVRGTSSWALLELPKRRPVVLDEMGEIVAERQLKHAISETPEKLPSLNNLENSFTHKVAFTELDQNAHVNNGRYINWLLDTFPVEFHLKNRVSSIQLNYLAEVFPDQTLRILREESAGGEYLFEVQNQKEKVLFRAKLQFRPAQ